jgi:hypothetical protein
MKMLDVVRRPDCIEAGIGREGTHIGHGADQIGRNACIDVEANLTPPVRAKSGMQLFPIGGSASRVEDTLLQRPPRWIRYQ